MMQKDPNAGRQKRKQSLFSFAGRIFSRRVVLAAALLSVIIMFSAWQLIDYTTDYVASQNASDELRDVYYDNSGEQAPVDASFAPPPTITPQPADSAQATIMAAPTATPGTLPAYSYPGNPYGTISSRFLELRKISKDIVGWIAIDGVLDEAVVQRDNIYYMNHDYHGRENVNGALFLDEFTDLHTRPYTLTVYGHNMRSGAMFGYLTRYESTDFYMEHPFITFDTMYEEGRYVIFSVSTLSLKPQDNHFFDFGEVDSTSIAQRSRAIRQLQNSSIFTTAIDVRSDDQLLLLVTCVENDNERRIIAARRLRPDETEAALLPLILGAQLQ